MAQVVAAARPRGRQQAVWRLWQLRQGCRRHRLGARLWLRRLCAVQKLAGLQVSAEAGVGRPG